MKRSDLKNILMEEVLSIVKEAPTPEEAPAPPEPTPLSPEDPLSAALKQAESKYGNSEFVRGLNRKERNVILKFIAVLLEEKLIKVEEGLLDTYQALGIRARDLKNALKKADEEKTISAEERKILIGVLKDDVKGKAFVRMIKGEPEEEEGPE